MNVKGVVKTDAPRYRRAYYWTIDQGRGEEHYSNFRHARKAWGFIPPGHRAVMLRKDKNDRDYKVMVAVLPEDSHAG